MSHKQIAILYHGGCPDGFGGAYAAWKKFGNTAEYIPLKHGLPPPEDMDGRTLYFIDFCYPKEIMDKFVQEAASVTVLDHHLGVRDVTESMPEYVFDEKRSGATIAWSYFHPNTPAPTLLKYVEDGDLYKFALPDSRSVLSYSYAQRFNFEDWDKLMKELEDPESRKRLTERGSIYAEHFSILIHQIMHKASLVSFEGYECYLASASDLFSSDVGNGLVKIKPPIALIANIHGDVLNVSLRSDASVDVSAIARKYGGNGHPRASAFRIKWGDPLPWKVLKEHENPRH
ncbi:MAG: DHHA1 domain-containing protein [bacterium]|nr:DHHA1 domain-containing protein [bacterium]